MTDKQRDDEHQGSYAEGLEKSAHHPEDEMGDFSEGQEKMHPDGGMGHFSEGQEKRHSGESQVGSYGETDK